MTKLKSSAQVQPPAAYKAEIDRLLRILNDPRAQANAKARREKEHAERLHVAQKKNQKVIEYLHSLVANARNAPKQQRIMQSAI